MPDASTLPAAAAATFAPGARSDAWTDLNAATHFGLRLLASDLRNPIAMLINLFSPLLVLGLFRMVGRPEDLPFLFPGMVCFTVMLFGAWPAQRVTLWFQQGIFQRLACAPVRPGWLVLAAGLGQVAAAVAQALVIAVVGVFGLGLSVHPGGLLLSLPLLALGAACFIAYGCLLACLVRRAELVSAFYMCTMLPMAFLGNVVLPASSLPAFAAHLRPFLPTALLADLVVPLLTRGWLPFTYPLLVAGLAAFTLTFAAVAIRFFPGDARG